MRFISQALIPATAISGTTPINSNPIASEQLYALSAQIVSSSGTIAGSLQLQGSNDLGSVTMLNTSTNPTHWNNIGTAATVTAGAVALVAQFQPCYRFIRAVFTPSAGTGNVTVLIMAQSF